MKLRKSPLEFLADALVAWRQKKSAPLRARAARLELEVAQLSVEEAGLRARALLEAGHTFAVSVRPAEASAPEIPAGYSPVLRGLFSEFPSIEARYGDQKLGVRFLGKSAVYSGYLRIGVDMGDAEVAVRPREDGIYVLHPDEDPALESPTILHWLVLLARLVEPDNGRA